MDEALGDFINANCAITIQIKQIEGNSKILTVNEPGHVCSAGQKFAVANLLVAVSVQGCEKFFPVLLL